MRATGLHDQNGDLIHDGDILVRHHEAIAAVSADDFNRMVAENPHVTFGYNVHPAYPAHDEEYPVKWDAEYAQWDVPRDYDNIPTTKYWRIKK